MRVGANPSKSELIKVSEFYHDIFIPVYIPNLVGYYENCLHVLKLCLTSLFKTVHIKTRINVISNNSCKDVNDYLNFELNQKKIHTLIIYSENLGKINSIFSHIRGSDCELITITDCDVLFKPGWQFGVEELFNIFPNVGFVSPLTLPQQKNYCTSVTLLYGMLNNLLLYRKLFDPESYSYFLKSTGKLIPENIYDGKSFYFKKKGILAGLGSGHFCFTLSKFSKQALIKQLNQTPFDNSEYLTIDRPIEKSGFLRLSTSKGFVFHIGNTAEQWMYDYVEQIQFKENFQLVKLNFYFLKTLSFIFPLLESFTKSRFFNKLKYIYL